MELMNRKKTIIVAIVAVVVLLIVIFVVVAMKKGSVPGAANGAPAAKVPAAPVTRLPAPENVIVPDAGAQNVSSSVAVPQVEAAAALGSNAKYRSFDIIVQDGQFMPSTIAVNQDDEVNLQIGAVGGDYDFTQPDYGFHIPLPDGKNVHFEFGATAAGTFVFYCSSCGGPAKGPVGYLIVAGK
jgi:hypothetical protein